jgi:hypothetical protein
VTHSFRSATASESYRTAAMLSVLMPARSECCGSKAGACQSIGTAVWLIHTRECFDLFVALHDRTLQTGCIILCYS